MATIQGVYIALFGRPADPDGLTFWQMKTGDGGDLAYLVGRLTWMPEYMTRFDGMSSAEIVNAVYGTLFNRPADPEGLAFFVDALDGGRQTIETIAINILDGARGTDAAALQHKLIAADHFTTALDLAEEGHIFADERATDAARVFLAGVTDDAATVPNVGEARAYLDDLLHGLETSPPVFFPTNNILVSEKFDATTVVHTAHAADGHGALIYSLGDTDADHFRIDPATGDIYFVALPDFEAPRDADGDNVYGIDVIATDEAGNSVTQSLQITLSDVDVKADDGVVSTIGTSDIDIT